MTEQINQIAKVLEFPQVMPVDFVENEVYEKNLDQAIKATSDLVYPLDDAGEKMAKSDATNINKFVRILNGYAVKSHKQKTSSVTAWKEGFQSKLKLLTKNKDLVLDQFAERKQERLDLVQYLLNLELALAWDNNNVKVEFQSDADMNPVVILSSLSKTDVLTKKARDFVIAIAANDLANQNKIAARHLVLENRCLREGINPPLTHIHLGSAFYASDDEFNAKVDELVVAEIARKEEMEARIIKDQEAKKQAEIDAALKQQQAEANRIAKEKAENEVTAKVAPEEVKEQPVEPKEAVHVAQDSPARYTDHPPSAVPGTRRSVTIKAEFVFDGISERVSDLGVHQFFLKQLPEKLQGIVRNVSSI